MNDSPSGASTGPNSEATGRFIKKAVLLSWLTISYNIIEGLVSVYFGISKESIALAGFGLDSFIEVGSATLVLWRFRSESAGVNATAVLELKKERIATTGISILFLLLALVTFAGSIYKLVNVEYPISTLPGFIVASLSLSFMYFLWYEKRVVALALNSATMMKDAACSMACIKLSVILFAGSLLYLVVPELWWADSVAGLVLSLLIGKEGWDTFQAARSPEFSGGCGCEVKATE
ncbi:MAG: cation transporter [Nitrospinota bacterium]|nr:cation transporter [Nitrospinota bacterium]